MIKKLPKWVEEIGSRVSVIHKSSKSRIYYSRDIPKLIEALELARVELDFWSRNATTGSCQQNVFTLTRIKQRCQDALVEIEKLGEEK